MLSEQLERVTQRVAELEEKIDKDMASNSVVDVKYMNVLNEARRENLSLREEIFLVRKIITTLKAGIVVAISLSCLAIVGFMIRVLLRCFRSLARKPAAETPPLSTRDPLAGLSMDKVRLRIDRTLRFGKSMDDSAIQRCTMYSTLVCNTSGFRQHHLHKKNR